MDHKKIVLADDVELFLMFETTIFNRKEFELISARDSLALFKIIREVKPDLVFMNFNMPDIDGDRCCRMIKGDDIGRNVPVIMVIHSYLEEEARKCREAGCDDILFKPLNRKDFMTTIHKFLDYIERAEQRFRARLPILYSTLSHDVFNGYSIDLSAGGMFLETEHPLTVNSRLNIEFSLPDNEHFIRCNGRGAWVNDPRQPIKSDLPAGMGVQFLNISPLDKCAIQSFIDHENGSTYYGKAAGQPLTV